jgi:hypothetical protein
MNIQDMTSMGMQFGVGLAVIPAVATTLIACSKIIFVNIIADIAVRILTANQFSMQVHGISLVEVPFLWKFPLISAVVGTTIAILSLIVHLANQLFLRYQSTHP